MAAIALQDTARSQSLQCGNSICEVGESVDNCFIDCATGGNCNSCNAICPLQSSSGTGTQSSSVAAESQTSVTASDSAESPVAEYIIELKEEPTLKRKVVLDRSVRKLERELHQINKELADIERSNRAAFLKATQRRIKELQKNLKEAQTRDEKQKVRRQIKDYRGDIRSQKQQYREGIQAILKDTKKIKREFNDAFNGFLVELTSEEAQRLQQLDFVASVHLNTQVNLTLTESVPLIGADQMHALGFTGSGVTIGIIDTGVDYTHPDLGGCFGEQSGTSGSTQEGAQGGQSSSSIASPITVTVCGDGICTGDENEVICLQDCGVNINANSVALRPNGQGSRKGWGNTGCQPGNNEWQCVDETIPDTTDYLQNTGTSKETFTFTDSGLTNQVIDRVTLHYHAMQHNSNANSCFEAMVRISGTDYLAGTQLCVGTGWEDVSYTYNVNPATNQPWTVAEINALEAGMHSLNPNGGGRVAQVYALVEYSSSAPTCGDNICNGAETCSSCPSDCGVCGQMPFFTEELATIPNGPIDSVSQIILSANLDNDNNQEIILQRFVPDQGGRIQGFENTGNFVFEESFTIDHFYDVAIPSMYQPPRDLLTAGDADGDGKGEVLLSHRDHNDENGINQGSTFFSHYILYESEFPGGFPSTNVWNVTVQSGQFRPHAAFADLNADGSKEIIISTPESRLNVYEKVSDNTFTQVFELKDAGSLPSPNSFTRFGIGDLNNNGKQEIIVPIADRSGGTSSSTKGEILLVENVGGVYQVTNSIPTPLRSPNNVVYAGDLDGDGNREFVARSFNAVIFCPPCSNYTLDVYELGPDNQLRLTWQYARNDIGATPHLDVKVDDFTGDGSNEILAYIGGGKGAYLFKNTGGNSFEQIAHNPFPTNGTHADRILQTADMDNNGRAELIITSGLQSDNSATVSIMSPAGNSTPPSSSCGNNVCEVGETPQSCPQDCAIGGNWTVSSIDNQDVAVPTSTDVVGNTVFTAYSMGPVGDNFLKLAKSTDNGQTFTTSVVTSESRRIQTMSLDAVNENILFISYYSGFPDKDYRIAKSIDGGQTWTITTAVFGDMVVPGYTSLHALDENNLFFTYSPNGRDLWMAKSNDGANSWTTHLVQVMDGQGGLGRYPSIKAMSSDIIYIGYDYQQSDPDLIGWGGLNIHEERFAKSTDGGNSWTITGVDVDNDAGGVTSMETIGPDVIFIAYTGDKLTGIKFAKSADAGATWQTQYLYTFEDGYSGGYSAISLRAIDAMNVLIVGHDNAIPQKVDFAKTSDGGATWEKEIIVAESSEGSGASMGINPNKVFVSFGSNTDSSLKMARYNSNNLAEYCGDNVCNGDETSLTCPQDCGTCGDTICNADENPSNCPADCGFCGDNSCTVFENAVTCPQDCGACGDAVCGVGEDAFNCPQDCGTCGNTVCESDESPFDCPQDCGAVGNWTVVAVDNQNWATDTSTDVVGNTVFTAYRSGESGELLKLAKSTDKGQTFSIRAATSEGTGPRSISMSAVNENILFISYLKRLPDWEYEIAKSTDSGETWTISPIVIIEGSTLGKSSLHALDENNLFFTYSPNNRDLWMAKSNDGGNSWTTHLVQLMDATGHLGRFPSIKAISPDVIYIGYGYRHTSGAGWDAARYETRFAKSTDGGQTWTITGVDVDNDAGGMTSMEVIDSNTILMAYEGDRGAKVKFAKSTDAGATWQTQHIYTDPVYRSISLTAVDAMNVFIAAHDMVSPQKVDFAETSDGGATWEKEIIVAESVEGHGLSMGSNPNNVFVSFGNWDEDNLKMAIKDLIITAPPPEPPGCKVIDGYDFVNNDNDPMDDHGHGTHVAATAAGKNTGAHETEPPSVCETYSESCPGIVDFYCPSGCGVSGDPDCCAENNNGCFVPDGAGFDGCFDGTAPFNSCLRCDPSKSELTWSRRSTCAAGVCGDDVCDASENDQNCPSDCVFRTCELRTSPPPTANTLDGVAPDAQIVAYKVLNSGGSGWSSDIIAAIERAVDPNQDGDFSDHLDIISLSLGRSCAAYDASCGPDDSTSQAIDNAVGSGVVAVISAGNRGPGASTIGSPGTARRAITVAASDKSDIIADFSSRGPVSGEGGYLQKPDVTAPGRFICAAQWDNAWASNQCFDTEHVAISGTSMAAPHVSGLAALLLSKYPLLSADDVKDVITQTATNIGYGANTQGTGRINAVNALTTPVYVASATHDLTVSQSISQVSLPVSIEFQTLIQGTHSYTTAAIIETGGISVSVSPFTVDETTTQLTIDISAAGSIPGGIHHGVIIFQNTEDAANVLRVPFTLFVDFSAPIITEIKNDYFFSGSTVTPLLAWKTNDITNGTLFYRPLGTSSFSPHTTFGTRHTLDLSTLSPGRYEFYLTATNIVGLSVTDDNNGDYYTFTAIEGSLPSAGFSQIASLPQSQRVLATLPGIDLNNNGKREIILHEGSDTWRAIFGIYEAQSENVFTRMDEINISGTASYHQSDTGDSDNDGLQEIVLYGRTSNEFNIKIYESPTAQSYPTEISWETPFAWWPIDAHIADLDGDAQQEIVSGDTGSNSVVIYENTGDNAYAKVYEAGFSFANGVMQSLEACDDLDNDGLREFIVGGVPDLYIVENTGDNAFSTIWSQQFSGFDGNQLNLNSVHCIGDTDGDGRKEFIAGGTKTSLVQFFKEYKLFEAEGDNTFTERTSFIFEAGLSDSRINAGDVNGDLLNDIVLIIDSQNAYIISSTADNAWVSLWHRPWFKPPTTPLPNKAIGITDHDADQHGEIIFNEYQGSTVQTVIYESDTVASLTRYQYVTLTENDCTINYTLTSINGNHVLEVRNVSNVCDDTWDQSIATQEGETAQLALTDLGAGNYAFKIDGVGAYSLEVSSLCFDEHTSPSIMGEDAPSAINEDIVLRANVSDANGLQSCEVCIASDALCDTEWFVIPANFSYGAQSGACIHQWNITAYNDAPYAVSMRVTDVGNNIATTTPRTVAVDTTGPTIQQVNIPPLAEIQQEISFSASIVDLTAVQNVTVQFNGQSVIVVPNNQTGRYEGSITAPSSPGSYPFILIAKDILDNTANVTQQVRIDEPITWSDDIVLTQDTNPSVNPAIAVDANDNTHIVWEEYSDGNPEIYYSKIDGSGQLIVHRQRLTSNIYNSKYPSIAVDSSNNLHIVWQDDRDGNKEIYYTKLTAQGVVLISTKRVTANLFSSEKPRIEVDSNVHVIWMDNRQGPSKLFYKKLDTNGNILQSDTKLTDSSLVEFDFSFPTVVYAEQSTIKMTNLNDITSSEIDLLGGRQPSVTIGTSIYVVAVDNQNNVALGTFDNNGNSINITTITTTGTASHPDVVYGQQSLHIVWVDTRLGKRDLFYTKRDGNGNVLINPQVVSDNATNATNPSVHVGSVNVIYTDSQNNNDELFFKTTTLDQNNPVISGIVAADIKEFSADIVWQTSEPTTSVVHFGKNIAADTTVTDPALTQQHRITLTNLEPSTQYFFAVESTDAFGNTAIDDNAGFHYTFFTALSKNRPALPTTFYGLVLYDNGTPASDVTVIASWDDTNDVSHNTSIKTLNHVEALAINDSSLRGYFLFNLGNIKAKGGSVITLSAPSAINAPYVHANPGGVSTQVSDGPLTLDVTAPAITVHHPQSTAYTTPFLSLNFSVNEEISWAAFSLNGNDQVTITTFQHQLINITTAVGENTLEVFARDLTGLQSTASVTFTVDDTIAPTVSFSAPTKVSKDVVLTANVTDQTNALSNSCEVCISGDGNCDTEWIAAQSHVDTGSFVGSCTYEWDPTTVPSGLYTINFRINDIADNTGTGNPASVVVDHDAPTQVTGLSIDSVLKKNALNLTWDANLESDVSHYNVFRESAPFVDISTMETIGTAVTPSYTDTNLASEQTYHYAVTAVDDVGNEETLVSSTSGTVADTIPPLVSISSPAAVLHNTQTLDVTYTVNENVSFCVYSLNSGPNISVSPTITVVDGQYVMELHCQDLGGNSGSATVSFTVDSSAPRAISDLVVSSVPQENKLQLQWSVVSDANQYNVYRAPSSFSDASTATLLSTVENNFYVDLTVESESSYYYAVTAVDKALNENMSVSATLGTVADTIAPFIIVSSPENILYNDPALQLLFTVNEQPATCLYSLNDGPQAQAVPGQLITAAEGKNTLALSCTDIAGNEGTSSVQFDVDAQTPARVGGFAVTTLPGENALRVTWTSSRARDLSHYTIYRNPSSFNDVIQMTAHTTTQGVSFNDEGLISEAIYYYAVTATDIYGNEDTTVTSQSGQVADTIPPSEVPNVTVTSLPSQVAIVISWGANQEGDFSHYNIYRSSSPGVLIQTISNRQTTSFTDVNLSEATTYHYTVTAVDTSGNEVIAVPAVSATTADLTAPTITLTSPQSITYNTPAISVEYQASEQTDWCGYSLNNGSTATLINPVVAQEGLNSISVQCNDTAGNVGESLPVWFTIDTIPPSPVTGLAVSSLQGQNSLSLSWNQVGGAASYHIYRAVSPFTEVSFMNPIATATATEFTDTFLVSDTTYFYAVTAVDGAGNEDTTVVSVSGTVADTQAPDPIQGLAVQTLAGENALQLNWSPSFASDFQEYKVYRSSSIFSDVSSMTPIRTTVSTSYKEEGLQSGATYYYAVTAVDEVPNENTGVSPVMGLVADTIPPNLTLVTPTNIKYNTKTLQLEYTASEPVSGCVYSLNQQANTSTVTILAEEGTNTFILYCSDDAGNVGQSPLITFTVDTVPPTAVTGMSVDTLPGEASLLVAWSPSTASDFSHYNVYRSSAPFSDVSSMTPVTQTQSTTITDNNLASEQTYHYAVTAVDDGGNEDKNVVTTSNTVADVNPPIITIVSPTPITHSTFSIDVSYTTNEPSTCIYSLNNGPATPIDAAATVTATEGSNALQLTCTDSVGNSATVFVSFDVDTRPPQPVTGLTISPVSGENALQLDWNPSPDSDLTSYKVYRAPVNFNEVTQASEIAQVTQNTYKDENLVSQTTYYYAVTAIDQYANENTSVSAVSGEVADTIPPVAVSGLDVTALTTEVGIQLQWNPSGESDLSHYAIYRSTSDFSSVLEIQPTFDTILTTNFTDLNVFDGTQYYYAVTAVDASGNELAAVTSRNAITLDLTSPQVFVSDTGERVTGTVILTASVIDHGGLDTRCEVCISNDGNCDTEWIAAQSNFNSGDNNGTCSHSWDTAIGNYTINFKVYDRANNEGTGIPEVVEAIDATGLTQVTIDLHPGWNLISLPIIPQDQSTSAVLSSITDSYNRIFYYDAHSEIWQAFNPQRTIFDQPNNLVQLTAGRGYWIDMQQAATVTIFGFELSDYQSDLATGWNYIGYPYQGTVNVSIALASLDDSYNKIYAYNAQETKWEVFNPHPSSLEPNSMITIDATKGYVIDIRQPTTWTP